MRARDYRDMLLALAPPGPALPADPDSTWGRLLDALAQELARVDEGGARLLTESDPRQSVEMLPDWERVLDLPDGCLPVGTSLQERQAAVVARLTLAGDQSRAAYVALAATLGYEVTIEEFRPFVAGLSRCGEELAGGHHVRCIWRVTVVNPPEALAEDLACILGRLAPAHTVVIVDHEESQA